MASKRVNVERKEYKGISYRCQGSTRIRVRALRYKIAKRDADRKMRDRRDR
jgi:hypothetical protein